MNMRFFHFGHSDAGFFLHSCRHLAHAYPSTEWPGLTSTLLPEVKGNTFQHYDVFVPVLSETQFINSVPSVLGQLPEYVIEDLDNKKCSLILDYSNESGTLALCAYIQETLKARGLNDFSNVLLLAQNRLLGAGAAGLCFYPFDCFIVITATVLCEQMDEAWNDRLHIAWKGGKVKDILCLNATPRMHRWLTVASLVEKGMLQNSMVSFPGQFYDKSVGLTVQKVLGMATNIGLDNLREAIQWLDQNAPLTVDEFAETGNALATKIDLSAYEKTILSLVTETGVDNTVQRVTEKTFKAFAIGHPSVVISHPGTMKAVEELGFDTFHEFIDHSYDEIDDWVLRMNKAIAEANAFSEAWRNGSIDIEKLQACSQKNRSWLLGGFIEFYSKHYAFPVLSLLASKY